MLCFSPFASYCTISLTYGEHLFQRDPKAHLRPRTQLWLPHVLPGADKESTLGSTNSILLSPKPQGQADLQQPRLRGESFKHCSHS